MIQTADRSASTGLLAFIAATTMLFAALTSAYIVRRGLAGDWMPVPLPLVVPGSVLLLIAGSLLLHWAQRNFKAGVWFGGAGLGVVFVLVLGYAWKQIGQNGISVASSPSAAFFYVLAGTFVVFIIGATAAVVWAGLRARSGDPETARARLKLVAGFWHYLDGLWLYLVLLLYLRS